MKNHKSIFPYLFSTRMVENGRRITIWIYKKLPEGVKRAKSLDEFRFGKPFLYCTIRGEYISDIFRPGTKELVQQCLEEGKPIYIK